MTPKSEVLPSEMSHLVLQMRGAHLDHSPEGRPQARYAQARESLTIKQYDDDLIHLENAFQRVTQKNKAHSFGGKDFRGLKYLCLFLPYGFVVMKAQ